MPPHAITVDPPLLAASIIAIWCYTENWKLQVNPYDFYIRESAAAGTKYILCVIMSRKAGIDWKNVDIFDNMMLIAVKTVG